MAANDFDADVIVVGAGPLGLLLAAELRLGGAAAAVTAVRRWFAGPTHMRDVR
ncbi:FAD-dependent monooxygenase [Nocardia australiensis]|uniref:FAD-dependent monooxygenase n=1 Tax=Nocardia australiensis TaxID=2887191 RepID=UPI001D14B6F3|nr:FAD-dependent monooxygenase [Nocardia australiensis]